MFNKKLTVYPLSMWPRKHSVFMGDTPFNVMLAYLTNKVIIPNHTGHTGTWNSFLSA